MFVAAMLLAISSSVNRPAMQAQARRFEVVSIKPCKSGSAARLDGKKGGDREPGRIQRDPQTLHEECQSLESLIRDAYLRYPDGRPWTRGAREDASTAGDPDCTECGFRFPHVSDRILRQPIDGGPGWLDSARYTIDAKTETPITQEMMRGPMMQAVLEERFKLKVRRQTRQVLVYELTVAEGGAKLRRSQAGSCIPFTHEVFDKLPPKRIQGQTIPIPCGAVVSPRNGTTEFPGTTIGGFCRNLSSRFDRDVVDKTGLDGFFDILVEAEGVAIQVDDPDAGLATADGLPRRARSDGFATFRAFQAAMPKIGLKLQPAKAAGVFLFVDHVERPSLN